VLAESLTSLGLPTSSRCEHVLGWGRFSAERVPRLRTLERKAIFEKGKRDRESSRKEEKVNLWISSRKEEHVTKGKEEHVTNGKEEKVKHLSGEEKWNRMITIISFLLYTTYVILAVLSLYFTSGPTHEDVALGGKFMLALAALVIAQFFSDLLARKAAGETKNSDWSRRK
jgi:uncharacterized membrane protein (DUF485 family)